MKVAIINENGYVGGHMGHAKEIVLVDLMSNMKSSHSPQEEGGQPRAKWLSDNQVVAVIVNQVSVGMFQFMRGYGIRVFSGDGLSIDESYTAFLNEQLGEYVLEDEHQHSCGCGHHEHEHQAEDSCGCGHDHNDSHSHNHGGGCGCH